MKGWFYSKADINRRIIPLVEQERENIMKNPDAAQWQETILLKFKTQIGRFWEHMQCQPEEIEYLKKTVQRLVLKITIVSEIRDEQKKLKELKEKLTEIRRG